jgi:hypothetical protein
MLRNQFTYAGALLVKDVPEVLRPVGDSRARDITSWKPLVISVPF